MSPESSWLLFEGSPFLPSLSVNSLKNVTEYVANGRVHTGIAIASEVAMVGVDVSALHQKDLDFLSFEYGVDAVDITHYFFGFTTPPSLILGGYLSRMKDLRETVKTICRETQDSMLLELNTYKAKHLVKATELCSSHIARPTIHFAHSIYDLCRTDPFEDNFYLTGLEASERLFQAIIGEISKFKPSS